ncbi:uncharacterized protein LOC113514504 isoform X2 [Galleria mellonella]|uniref:Uncharacterized protein LOC113514504 isoform X2 n=1 Tax=Galleria mellonella TaxID=7137 RepID=A0ABM3MN67_GALME|nr:uncharacterized protein LOC113514504 isoform X2 [Galleria mellonella]
MMSKKLIFLLILVSYLTVISGKRRGKSRLFTHGQRPHLRFPGFSRSNSFSGRIQDENKNDGFNYNPRSQKSFSRTIQDENKNHGRSYSSNVYSQDTDFQRFKNKTKAFGNKIAGVGIALSDGLIRGSNTLSAADNIATFGQKYGVWNIPPLHRYDALLNEMREMDFRDKELCCRIGSEILLLEVDSKEWLCVEESALKNARWKTATRPDDWDETLVCGGLYGGENQQQVSIRTIPQNTPHDKFGRRCTEMQHRCAVSMGQAGQ